MAVIFTFERLATLVNVNQTLPSSLLFSYWWLSIKHDITETTSPPTHESSARVSRQIGGKHVAVPVYVKLFRIILDVVSGVFWKITSAAWNKNNIYGGGWLVVASWLAPLLLNMHDRPIDTACGLSVRLSVCRSVAVVHQCITAHTVYRRSARQARFSIRIFWQLCNNLILTTMC